MVELSRRSLLAVATASPGLASPGMAAAAPGTGPGAGRGPRDEAYWAGVAALYDPPPAGVIQLENGNFGAMARSVRVAYEAYTDRVNRETTLYTRGSIGQDLKAVRAKVADLLGVGVDEIAFTRGGTESMQTLIGGYNRLKPGDGVLYADLDYDSMQASMESLARLRGVRVHRIDLPEPATREALVAAYDAALAQRPDVRLVLLTQLSHRTGLVVPVAEIVASARARGVDVLLDSGHALGQTDFSLPAMGVEFAGLNLHKWIGAPLGVGVVYIRRERIADIDPSPLERPSDRIDARVHTGTVNFAALLAASDAIDLHRTIGVTAKAARLRYLRDRWVEQVRSLPGVQVLTPDDPALHAGITSFRLAGRTSLADNVELRKDLLAKDRIFTVERDGPAKGACVRVTPSFWNTPAHMDSLAAAIRKRTV
ncbi:MAG: aminotransferase class V-fold PLP-dependent enzyme [Caulobacter sp.]|nr:aminotransferase class V-fold PLP-dependent enzyme [Caulobacter sp.]